MRILFIEDEERLRTALCRGLRAEGHDVVAAGTGSEGLRLAREDRFDVIVCDILLPHVNGFQICARLREEGNWTPMLMLTAKDGEWDQAEALDAGADDYLTKPFSLVVLRARLRALARRGSRPLGDEPTIQRTGDIVIDFRNRRCVRAGTTIELSRREFDVLAALLARPGEVVGKEELMRSVWGPDFDGDPNIVEVYVGYLRKKIDVPFGIRSIETIRGAGYRFDVRPGSA
ncbi:MAG TPA: response regulator transcription factor [Acidimicrobiales bacterium]|nr:response regulator transcription factor [Acidimicrobiales bacterium]